MQSTEHPLETATDLVNSKHVFFLTHNQTDHRLFFFSRNENASYSKSDLIEPLISFGCYSFNPKNAEGVDSKRVLSWVDLTGAYQCFAERDFSLPDIFYT